MSVILKALKNSAAEGKAVEDQPAIDKPVVEKKQEPVFEEGEGFFQAKPNYVQKSELPELIRKTSNIRTSVIVLSALLVGAICFSATIYFLRHKNAIRPEVLPATTMAAATPQPVELVDTAAMASEAQNLFNSGNLDGAQELYKKAIAANSNDAMLHNGLGLVYLKKDLFANAQTEFESALAINDKCAECLNSLGMVKSLTDNPAEAKIYLEKAIGLVSDYADPYFNLAVLNEKMGDFGNAVKNYRQFILLYANDNDGVKAKVKNRISLLTGAAD